MNNSFDEKYGALNNDYSSAQQCRIDSTRNAAGKNLFEISSRVENFSPPDLHPLWHETMVLEYALNHKTCTLTSP
jgi:hypothetical protein